ncbi:MULTISPECIES: salicylate synthase [unclassified Streptomyces]|uniref:salicylate synthase n=1 Tax=unclassified Streptomyces TaxID=2593676 RepID=UPI0022584D7D|nr:MULTISPECIES: salicylate synthase [unclassified Streptomyces]WSP59203.1 salicylate synthase [Streptomyces sp. NBC_01241]WSU20275.1 salicylate synthase [Streptomyces sp. NBC_01108]MCX4790954.1 salicylate synthase [Streptomyces sp. NBC_01221]MCX4793321.1 salicylate synthase [Streptomyces sp. NBC_01242]WSJ34761.1 salicylate synthase [Streptomyces sp. NBC_01321]
MPTALPSHTRAPFTGTPVQAAVRLAEHGPHDQYVVYEQEGAWWYAGGVRASLVVDREHVTLDRGDERIRVPWQGDPLAAVRELLAQLPQQEWRVYGWAAFELSYALAGETEGLGEAPLMHLVLPCSEVRIGEDGARLRCTDEADAAAIGALLAAEPAAPTAEHVPLGVDLAEPVGESYQEGVKRAVAAIRDGDLQKVILSRAVPVAAELDLPATYLAGRAANSPARSFLLRIAGVEAAGFSPETVVEVAADGNVSTQPLAGTRALTGDGAADAARRAELLVDPKEIYEHAISVQVAWDEMTAVCAEGSVRVDEFMTVKARGSVQHLASRVAGRLPQGEHGPWPALAAVFPAVTASGVPKAAAYRAIRELEDGPRGLYSGAVLAVGSDGSLDAALTLRTVFRAQGRTWLRAGAGIVGQSTPEREFEETCEKMRSVSRTLVQARTAGQSE